MRLHRDLGARTSGRLDSGVWTSREQTTDRLLVFVETPVDALAYQQVNGVRDARYVAVGAKLQPRQGELLVKIVNDAPPGARLVLAFAANPSSEALASHVKAIAKPRAFERHARRERRSWMALVGHQQRDWLRAQGLRPPALPGPMSLRLSSIACVVAPRVSVLPRI